VARGQRSEFSTIGNGDGISYASRHQKRIEVALALSFNSVKCLESCALKDIIAPGSSEGVITMNWYYVRDGNQDGPHSDESVQALLRSGSIDARTLVWREGMQDWQPISQAAPQFLSARPPMARPTATMAPASKELRRLLQIAKGQRGVNMVILLSFLGYGLLLLGGVSAPAGRTAAANQVPLLALVACILVLAAVVLEILYVYRLAAALGHTAIVWVLGVVFLGCIGLLLLLILSSKATKELRGAGFRVGLLGCNPKDIEQRMLGT
jgi:hypothetical protein